MQRQAYAMLRCLSNSIGISISLELLDPGSSISSATSTREGYLQ